MTPDPRPVPARVLLHERLATQVRELEARESEVRTGSPEGVHKARVACRRLRAALATFRPLLDREVTDPVRDELRWLGGVLGGARDNHVVHARLGALLAELGQDGPARERLDTVYDARGRIAQAAAEQALDSDRHRDLVASLDRLVDRTPWREEAHRPAAEVLPDLVARDWRRVRRGMRHVDDAPDRDHALHRVRKDAKRLRYAAETLEPVWGPDATRLVVAATALQEHLGERQDTVVSRADLRDLRAGAEAAGEDVAAYQRLHDREVERAVALDRDLPGVWGGLSSKDLVRGLR